MLNTYTNEEIEKQRINEKQRIKYDEINDNNLKFFLNLKHRHLY